MKPSPSLKVFDPTTGEYVSEYSTTIPKKHKDSIVKVLDEFDNIVSIQLHPCIQVDHVHSLRQILDIRYSCLEQLKTRELNRRYYVNKLKQKTVDLIIDYNWPEDVLNIIGYGTLPIQLGLEDDIEHNLRGFEWVINSIIEADRWYNLPWRLYSNPLKTTNYNIYNLQLINAFNTEDNARLYVNQLLENLEEGEYHDPYYLYYYEQLYVIF